MFRKLKSFFGLLSTAKVEIDLLEKQALKMREELYQLKKFKAEQLRMQQELSEKALMGMVESIKAAEKQKKINEAKMEELFTSIENEMRDDMNEVVSKRSREEMEDIVQKTLAFTELQEDDITPVNPGSKNADDNSPSEDTSKKK